MSGNFAPPPLLQIGCKCTLVQRRRFVGFLKEDLDRHTIINYNLFDSTMAVGVDILNSRGW